MCSAKEQFGFYFDRSGKHVTCDNLTIHRDGSNSLTGGVVFGSTPLQGIAELELEILRTVQLSTSASLRFGVVRCQEGTLPYEKSSIPDDISIQKNHLAWTEGGQIWNLLNSKIDVNSSYGSKSLSSLKEGDRVGMQIVDDGDLYFHVNGVCQGLAAHHIYKKGWNLYPVIDVSPNQPKIKIVKAGALYVYTSLYVVT